MHRPSNSLIRFDQDAISVYNVSSLSQISRLEKYFGLKAPSQIASRDYEIYRCGKTNLEFAQPMEPGNAIFYKWIASQPGYYPGVRWEYQAIIDRIDPVKIGLRVADVGCGDGQFLVAVKTQRSAAVLGVDTLAESVAICESKGVAAACGFVEDVLVATPALRESFDVVTSFHCLEYVPDPMAFLGHLKELVRPGGLLYVSTPLSPMSFEHAWFDPQNHPPHHLTRWTLKAYRQAAEALRMDVSFVTPRSGSLLAWVWRTYRLRITGSPLRRPPAGDWGKIFFETLRLPLTFGQLWRGFARAKVYGADTVLVVLTRRNG